MRCTWPIWAAAGIGTLIFSPPVWAGGALPTNGTFVAGQGAIAGSGNNLVINQSTSHGIIDWKGFSIGAGNTVLFNNGSGATLNRVTGGTLSRIDGLLKGSGSIYLVNPQGVVIGAGGRVVTNGSFVASSRDIPNSSFMSGNGFTASGSSNGAIVNDGAIRSTGGNVILFGHSVTNNGSISAPSGTASLAAGNRLLFQPTGGDSRIAVSGGAGSVVNKGSIAAAQAELNAAGGDVYTLLKNNGGISASGTSVIGGHVWLTAGGTVHVEGNVSAVNAGGSGGTVTVRGQTIDAGGTIDASATAPGASGGEVSIVATGTATVGGTIRAQGGDGGTGGFVETSGLDLNVLDAAKIVTNAFNGIDGRWLIDPLDFTIASSGGDITGAALSSNLATTDVTINTATDGHSGTGVITVNDTVSWSSAHTLTLDATAGIVVNAGIVISGSGGLDLETGTGDYSFGLTSTGFTGHIDFGATNNGGTLRINGTDFTLLYSVSDLAGINTDSGLQGNYALAGNLDDANVAFTPLGTDGAGNIKNANQGYSGTFTGLGHTISNINVDTGSAILAGVFGYATGTLRDVGVVGGSVSGGDYVGGLAGAAFNISDAFSTSAVTSTNYAAGGTGGLAGQASGTVSTVFATGAVNAATIGGGLIGTNAATLSNAFATGNVTVTLSNASVSYAGGLVGANTAASITDAYATGRVTGSGSGSFVGGLVGLNNFATLTNVYAIAQVTSGTEVGGLIGDNESGTVVNGYVDTDYSGTFDTIGTVNGAAGTSTGSLSTAQMQSGSATFSGSAWGGGSGGLYPYLKSFYPNGVQAITGNAYTGSLLLATSATTYTVEAYADGADLGGATLGSQGQYYIALPGGTLTGSQNLLTVLKGQGANAFVAGASGNVAADLKIGTLSLSSGDNSLSAMLTGVAAAEGSLTSGDFLYSGSALTNGTSLQIVSSSATGFTLDALPTGAANIAATTTATGADITIGHDIALSGSNGLSLNAAGGITFGANVAVSGSGAVSMVTGTGYDYDLGTHTLAFTGGSSSGASLSIDNVAYTIVYNATGLQNINNALGSSYALAGNIDLNGVTWTSLGTDGAGSVANSGNGFAGTFAGLGHTISNLTVTATDAYQGLFGFTGSGSLLRDVGLVGGNVGGGDRVGALAGEADGTIRNSYSTATVAASGTYIGGLVGYLNGTVTIAYDTGAVSGTGHVGGLVGHMNGSGALVTNSYATGSVSSTSGDTGGLVGNESGGTISNSYATGRVAASGGNAGGLVGVQWSAVSNSYATGNVSGVSQIGGLVGYQFVSGATVTNAYSTGSVTGSGSNVGGLIGRGQGTITSAYATGAVSGGSSVGGFIGNASNTVTDGYWDTQTTGKSSATGTGSSTGMTGLSTASLQGALPGSFDTSVWGTGTGLYPYLKTFYTSTPQAISGTVYAFSGATLSGTGVTSVVNGTVVGSATTGANGYYYVLVPNNTIGSGAGVLSYVTVPSNGAAVVSANGTVSGVDIVAGTLTSSTTATSLSTVASNAALLTLAEGSNSSLQTLVSGITGRAYFASGATFNVDQAASGALFVETTASDAFIAVSAAQSFSGSNGLSLIGTGNISIGQNIAVSGSGAVTLTTGAGKDYTLATGKTLDFGSTNNGATLAINGTSYTLLYDMTGVAGMNGSSNAFALAHDIDASGAGTYSASVAASFSGMLAGLNHTLSNLTINDTAGNDNVGLIGTLAGTVRDLTISAASITGGDGAYVGVLAGSSTATLSNLATSGTVLAGNTSSSRDVRSGGLVAYQSGGAIVTSHSSADVTSGDDGLYGTLAGGLVGYADGVGIDNSYATGVVTVGSLDLGGAAGGGLVGSLSGTSTLTSDYATGAVNGGRSSSIGGLAGYSAGSISLSYATGSINGTNGTNAGGLVGFDGGSIDRTHATGDVGVGDSGHAGGLVGNLSYATVSNSYATGQAYAGSTSASAGGLVGVQDSGSSIDNSYATGGVGVVADSSAGGLVGYNSGTITNAYAMGSVSGYSNSLVGGIAGYNESSISSAYATGMILSSSAAAAGGVVGRNDGTITDVAWDTTTSGTSTGIGADTNAQSATGYTTSALQGALPSGFDSSAWGTGAGLYPYLKAIYATAPEYISGTLYFLDGAIEQAVPVHSAVNGVVVGTATSGANGYYYTIVPAGTIAASAGVVSYGTSLASGANAVLASSSVSGLDVLLGYLTQNTTVGSLSMVSSNAAAVTAAVGSNADLQSFVGAITRRGYVVSLPSNSTFNIDTAASSGLFVLTTGTNVDISVGTSQTFANSDGIALRAAGNIFVSNTITVSGSGQVALWHGSGKSTNIPASINFTGGSSSGASLQIDGDDYTLLYSMSDLQNIDNNLRGNYALAANLDATSTSSWTPIGTDGAGNLTGSGFTGKFEGLKHTISNFTLSMASTNYVGLFGAETGATIRDITVSGSTTGASYVGGILGYGVGGTFYSLVNNGTVTSANTNQYVGGIIGQLVDGGSTNRISVNNVWVQGNVSGGAYTGGTIGAVGDYATLKALLSTANSVSGGQYTGGLVGSIGNYATMQGEIDKVVLVSGGNYTGGVAGYIGTNGIITDSYGTGAVSGGDYTGGTFGEMDASTTIQWYRETGSSVTGGSRTGGLVGYNLGSVTQAYNIAAVAGTDGAAYIGGAVGYNSGTVSEVTASGASVGPGSGASVAGVGGLVGWNTGTGSIVDSAAIGAANGGSSIGGLVGINDGTIATSFSAASAVGSSSVGGVIGQNNVSSGIANVYWATDASGLSNAIGGGSGSSAGMTAQTVSQLMAALPSGFNSGIWGTFTAVLPYVKYYYSYGNAPSAVSGFVFAQGGASPSGGETVSVAQDRTSPTTTSAVSNATGFYYATFDPGTIASGTHLIAYTSTGARVDTTTAGSIANFTIWDGTLIAPTTYNTLSSLLNVGAQNLQAQNSTLIAQVTSGVTGLYTWVQTLTTANGKTQGYIYKSGGAFTLDKTLTLSNGLYLDVSGTNASVKFANALTVSNGAKLYVHSTGGMTVGATITVPGSGAVDLGYVYAATGGAVNTDFELTNGSSIDFSGGSGAGAKLTINNTAYTLIYDTTALQNINNGLTGSYALATSLDASAVSGFVPLGTDGAGNVANSGAGFSGNFTGLGHAISGLVVNNGTNAYAGLFGYSSGVVREVGLAGGSITGGNSTGALVGYNTGLVDDSYSTVPVSATGTAAGGLIGTNTGTLTIAYSTGEVDGANDVGGAVGDNLNSGFLYQVLAGNNVSGAQNVGGLIGYNNENGLSGSIVALSISYGTVSGTSNVGGLVGDNAGSSYLIRNYWDQTVSGLTNAYGVNTAYAGYVYNATTAALQPAAGGAPYLFDSNIWGSGTGLYPYLKNFFNGTPQAVSGYVYSNGGAAGGQKLVGSGIAVTALVGGTGIGTTKTGVNGYYYFQVAPGTISGSGSAVLAYTNSGSAATDSAGARIDTLTGTNNMFDVLGGMLIAPTAETTYTTAVASDLKTEDAALITTAEGSDATAQTLIGGISTYGYISSAATFTFDPSSIAANTYVHDKAGDIVVSTAVDVPGNDTLTLHASGNLNIDQNMTVSDAGAVWFGFDTYMTFRNSSSLNFTGGEGTGAKFGENYLPYSLLYTMAELQAVNASSTTLAANYALATPLDALVDSTTPASWVPIGTNGTGTVTNGGAGFTGTFEGLGNAISNLTVNLGSNNYAGVFGFANGTLRDVAILNMAVTGGNYVGPLVGWINYGWLYNSYATGSATASQDYSGGLAGRAAFTTIYDSYSTATVSGRNYVGGLAGGANSTIYRSYATGNVTGSVYVGGLIGDSSSTLQDVYATGNVSGTTGVGGLVGNSNGTTIKYAYATGAVTGSAGAYGLVGGTSGSATLTNVYWDTQTSGMSLGCSPSICTGTGLTTAQLQGTLPTGFSSSVWGTATNHYPYFIWQYAAGPPTTVSGYAFSDIGITPVAHSVAITALLNGTQAGVTTGVNGYYYFVFPYGTVDNANGTPLLVYTGGSNPGAHIANLTYSLTDFDIMGGMLIGPVSGASYSAIAGTNIKTLDASLLASAIGADSTAQGVVDGLSLYGYTTSASSFDFDQTATISGSFYVGLSSPGGTVTIDHALTVADGGHLAVAATGTLPITAAVTVQGAGSLSISADQDYSLNGGHPISFTGGSGSGAALSLNRLQYSLLYSMTDVQAINSGLTGNYALAQSLDATSVSFTPLGTNGSGTVSNSGVGFSGHYTGLGYTISNLATNTGSNNYAGMFGYFSGQMRDFGLVGGSASGKTFVGDLAGYSSGRMTNVFATGSASGTSEVGGLVGDVDGTIVQSYAAGAVASGQASGSSYAGGLAGLVGNTGNVSNSYASGSVAGTGASVGGFVGANSGTISNAYAAGAVSGGASSVGGFAGYSSGTISLVYATGYVTATGGSGIGGLVGSQNSGSTTNSYWDTGTSGQASSGGSATGKTTAQLQGALPSGFSGTYWSTGTGLYPYLNWQFATTPQVLSGTTYSNAGSTVLKGASVAAYFNGAALNGGAAVSSGANGYYYMTLPAGTITSGGALLVYDGASSPGGGYFNDNMSAGSATGIDIWASTLRGAATTSATSASTVSLATNLASVIGSSGSLATYLGGLAKSMSITDTAASFDVDEDLIGAGFTGVRTTAGAITVSAAQSWSSSATLTLDSYTSVVFNANVTVSGAGSLVIKTNDGGSGGDYQLNAATIDFGATNNGAALTVNATSYTLLYNMAGIAGINGRSTSYALATNIDASGSGTYTAAVATSFSGTLAGLGHTVANLTIASTTGSINVGLIGKLDSGGNIRDLGVSNASVSRTGSANVGVVTGYNVGTLYRVWSSGAATGGTGAYVGGLAGYMDSTSAVISQSFSGVNVSGGGNGAGLGGLVGLSNGTISQSYATGTVRDTEVGSTSDGTGALVGWSFNGVFNQDYATGAVIVTNGVANPLYAGGFAGGANATFTNSYWNSATTGISVGCGGDSGCTGSLTGQTTANLQGSLPTGFDSSVWQTGTGLYPYLAWQFSGTPQAIAGTAYSDSAGTTALAGATVKAYLNGASANTLGSTGANGYYYLLVAPGTLTGSQQLYTFVSGNTTKANAFVQNASGSQTGIDLYAGSLYAFTGAGVSGQNTYSGIVTALNTAVGSKSGSDLVYTASGGLVSRTNLFLSDGDTSGLSIDAALNVGTAKLAIGYAGTLTQSAAITAGKLSLSGSSAVTLSNTSNAVDTLSGTGAAITFADNVSLAVGSSGLTGTAAVRLTSTGDITLNGVVTAGTNLPVVLNATGNFVNNVGSGAVVTSGTGRWLIYSAAPGSDTFGNLDSGNTAIWNNTFVTLPGGSVTQTGSRYIFAYQPTIAITTTAVSKYYGDDAATDVASAYQVSGLMAAVSGAYLGDTAAAVYSGTPTVTSTGSAATAGVSGSPYLISAVQGGFTVGDGYALSISNLGHLTVNARPITVTVDAKSRYYGDTNPTLTYVVGGQGLVNGDALTGALTTVADTHSIVGDYDITQGTLAASANYDLTTFTQGTLSVTARPITVTADAQSRYYGDANPTLTYTVGGQGLVNGDTLTGALTTVADLTSAVGDYAITQNTLAASSNYDITGYTQANLTVTARPITVTADAQSRRYGDANPTFTYTVGGLGLANGDTLAGVLTTVANATSDVGNYDITRGSLSDAANTNYAITYNVGTLGVTQRTITIIATDKSRYYGDANPALTYTIGGFGLANGDTLSGALTTAADTTSSVGNYAITQGTLAASSNYYLDKFTAGSLAVTARPITITADDKSRHYGDANPALTYVIGGEGLTNGDSLTGALTTVADGTSAVAGYDITQGTLAASSNYDVTYNAGTLSVTARPITITADAQTRYYGDANPALTYVVGGDGLVNGDTLTGALTTVASGTSSVGFYAIAQGTLAASANYGVSFTGNTLSVTARPITVTADDQRRIYGDANPALTYTVGGLGLANGDVLTGVLTTVANAASDVGRYDITQGSLTDANNTNYAITYNVGTLGVAQRTITIIATDKSRHYGDANPALTYTVGGLGLANGDTLSGALTTAADVTSSVGNYAITQGTLAASSNYYLDKFTAGSLAVTARPITITADDKSRHYGDANPAFTYVIGGDGLVNGDALTGGLTTLADATSAVAGYAVTQGTLAAGANYDLTYTAGTLSVTARPITLTADAQTRYYGDANPALTYVVGGDGLVNGDALTGALATPANGMSSVGGYAITQGTLAASANYDVSFTGNTLNVTARPITVTADAKSRQYGDANPTLTYVVGGLGLVNGDALSGALTTAADALSAVGAYAIAQGTITGANNTNYAIAYTGANLSVTARPIAITASAQTRHYGDANPALTYTIGGQGLVNGDALTGGLTTLAGATSSIGGYDITQGTLAASTNYTITTYTPATLTVTARPLTITADAQTRHYGDANPTLTYVIGGQGLVNGDTLTGGLATSAGATSAVGSYGIAQGTLAASSNYDVSYTAAELSVTARPITVTANAQSRYYGDVNPSLTYVVGGNGLVNGDTLAGALTTAANGTSAVGGYAVAQGTVTDANNTNYAIAYTGATLNVTARPISVTADAKSRIYGDANPALTYAVGGLGLVNGDTLSGALTTAANATSAVGGYAIAQGTLAASSNYLLTAYTPATLTVTARAITVTADAQTRRYGDANPALTYTIGGLGLVNGDALSGTLTTAANGTSAVGGYAIAQGTLAASSNYSAVFTAGTLTVTARPITVTADAQTRHYGDANPALTYVVGGQGLVNGDTLTGALTTAANATSAVGGYAIAQGTLAASSNYDLTAFTPATLTVTARPITVTADAKSRLYGDANPALTYVVGGQGLVNGDTLTGALTTAANATSGIGGYAIAQGTLAASSNYDLTAYTPATLTVTARPITVTADAKSRTYGDANPALTYVVGGQGLVNGDTLTGGLSTTADASSAVGGYAIAQGTLAASANYALTAYTPATLTITARPITVTAAAQTRRYGDANPALTYTVGGSGLVNGDTLSGALATAAGAVSGIGDYAIVQGSLAASSNYDLTAFTPATLTITARPITVTADAQTRRYGDANPALTYVVGGQGLVNGDTLTGGLATAADVTTGIGSYAITQGTLAASTNYSVSYTQGALSITARPISVTGDAKSRQYGDANPALTYTVGGQGLVNGDTLTGALTTAADVTTGIGSYAIAQGTLTASQNYAVSYTAGTLSITARPIAVVADAKSRQYGDANPALTYVVGGQGLVNGDTLTGGLATAAGAATGVGNYAITQGSLVASANYSLSYTPGILSITARPITVTADAKSRKYGDANPTLTYAVGGQGLVNGDTLTGALTTAANAGSSVGAYAIGQGTLVASANYAVSYTGATLTVTPATLSITANDTTSPTIGQAVFTSSYAGFVNGENSSLVQGLQYGLFPVTGNSLEYDIVPFGATATNYDISYFAGLLTLNPPPPPGAATAPLVTQGGYSSLTNLIVSGSFGSQSYSDVQTTTTGDNDNVIVFAVGLPGEISQFGAITIESYSNAVDPNDQLRTVQ